MKLMRHNLVIDGKNFADFGVWISGHGTLNAPVPDVETVSVPGRNGDLTMDNGRYQNIPVTYQCFVRNDLLPNLIAVKNYLLENRGYRRIEDGYHPEHYRVGRYVGGSEVVGSQMLRQGYFTLEFDCKPERWLKSGEAAQTVGSGAVLRNPTGMPAKPLIKATGNGSITIGDYTVTVANNSGADIYIDCELMDAYSGSLNRNNRITTTAFPVLGAGDNTITFNGLTNVEITPRWWDF